MQKIFISKLDKLSPMILSSSGLHLLLLICVTFMVDRTINGAPKGVELALHIITVTYASLQLLQTGWLFLDRVRRTSKYLQEQVEQTRNVAIFTGNPQEVDHAGPSKGSAGAGAFKQVKGGTTRRATHSHRKSFEVPKQVAQAIKTTIASGLMSMRPGAKHAAQHPVLAEAPPGGNTRGLVAQAAAYAVDRSMQQQQQFQQQQHGARPSGGAPAQPSRPGGAIRHQWSGELGSVPESAVPPGSPPRARLDSNDGGAPAPPGSPPPAALGEGAGAGWRPAPVESSYVPNPLYEPNPEFNRPPAEAAEDGPVDPVFANRTRQTRKKNEGEGGVMDGPEDLKNMNVEDDKHAAITLNKHSKASLVRDTWRISCARLVGSRGCSCRPCPLPQFLLALRNEIYFSAFEISLWIELGFYILLIIYFSYWASIYQSSKNKSSSGAAGGVQGREVSCRTEPLAPGAVPLDLALADTSPPFPRSRATAKRPRLQMLSTRRAPASCWLCSASLGGCRASTPCASTATCRVCWPSWSGWYSSSSRSWSSTSSPMWHSPWPSSR